MLESVESRRNRKMLPVNVEIKAMTVRLISDTGENRGLVKLNKALEYAKSKGLDLVQMNSDSTPVCKVMNYGKHLFNKKKSHRHLHRTSLKEIKFRVATDVADYQVKLRKLKLFLEQGNKVKVTLRFRGREVSHQELGMAILQRVKEDLVGWGRVEQEPELDRMQLSMVLVPQGGRARSKGNAEESKQGRESAATEKKNR